VLDPYWIFAAHAQDALGEAPRPVCALPKDDPWMDNILRPIIESAGYRVVGSAEAETADVVIASAEGEPPQGAEGKLLKIRSQPDLVHDSDDSIYRYDRAGLLAALSRSAAGRKG